MDITLLMDDISNNLTRIESLLDRGQTTPDDLLAEITQMRHMADSLVSIPQDRLAPHLQGLLNLNAQLASLQHKIARARDGLGEAITDVDKRRKALHNYAATTKKQK